MLRCPLISSLFPYTTLFRSYVGYREHPYLYPHCDTRGSGSWARSDSLWHGDGAQDRKSTRLNSSHVANSYAVFCLKKKISSVFDINHVEVSALLSITTHVS